MSGRASSHEDGAAVKQHPQSAGHRRNFCASAACGYHRRAGEQPLMNGKGTSNFELVYFFADKRVKVSLFLQDGLQKKDGVITLTYNTPLPPGADLPGTISRFDPSGAPLGVDSFGFPAVEVRSPPPFSLTVLRGRSLDRSR